MTASVPVGTIVPIVVRTREIRTDDLSGQLIAINGILITITGPTGSTTVSSANMNYIRDGEYYYNFDTTGLAKGNYDVTAKVNSGISSTARTYSQGTIRVI